MWEGKNIDFPQQESKKILLSVWQIKKCNKTEYNNETLFLQLDLHTKLELQPVAAVCAFLSPFVA